MQGLQQPSSPGNASRATVPPAAARSRFSASSASGQRPAAPGVPGSQSCTCAELPLPQPQRRSAGAPCCVSARAVSTQRRGNSVGPSDGRRVNLGSHSVPTGSLSFWETWIWLAKEGSRREAAGKRSGSRGRSELEPSSLAIVPGGRDPGTAWFPGVALAQAPSRGSSQGPSGRVR